MSGLRQRVSVEFSERCGHTRSLTGTCGKEEHPRLEPAMAQGQGGGELCEGTCSILGRLVQGGQFSLDQTS